MRNVLSIFKKEFTLYFTSPVAYAIITIFMLLAGFFFYNLFSYYAMVSQQLTMQGMGAEIGTINVTEGVLSPFHMNLAVVILLLVPLMTMRLFSEEMRNGTFELLMTYPVRNYEVVLGKFFAALAFYATLLLLTLLYPVIVLFYATPDATVFLTSLLGLFLMGGCFIALGVFVSSLTENQVIAGGLTFGFCLLFWLIGWMESTSGSNIGLIFKHLSLIDHYQNFARGVIDTRDLVYFLNFTVLMLFLTLRNLDSKRWRG